jgi:hypothetical protein
MPKLVAGRGVKTISVLPRTSAQRDCLARAAKAAKVSLSYYVLESALMVAAEEGFTAPAAPAEKPWTPRRRKPGRASTPGTKED